jgi:hypothetical protein
VEESHPGAELGFTAGTLFDHDAFLAAPLALVARGRAAGGFASTGAHGIGALWKGTRAGCDVALLGYWIGETTTDEYGASQTGTELHTCAVIEVAADLPALAIHRSRRGVVAGGDPDLARAIDAPALAGLLDGLPASAGLETGGAFVMAHRPGPPPAAPAGPLVDAVIALRARLPEALLDRYRPATAPEPW